MMTADLFAHCRRPDADVVWLPRQQSAVCQTAEPPSWNATMSATPFELAELADSLGMIVGNHGRRNLDGSFSRAETTYLLRVARVLGLAQKVLGDRPRALQWLKHQNRALRFQTPLSQLETSVGTERIIALLRRIDGGTFA